MAAPKINGFTIAYVTVGGVILWSGVKGESLSNTFKGLLSGKAPSSDNTQSIGSGLSLNETGSSSASAASGTASVPDGSPNKNGVAALKAAAKQYGWDSGAEWQALNYVEMREAGYNLTAKNPSSGAYGMAQFINGPSEYAQYGGNPDTYDGQAVAMVNYIKQRYGDPVAAADHEKSFNWY